MRFCGQALYGILVPMTAHEGEQDGLAPQARVTLAYRADSARTAELN
jgi:hypothetical protein